MGKNSIPDHEEKIWEFIYQKLVVKSKYAKISDELWNDYIKSNKTTWTAKEMNDFYDQNMKKNMHKAFMDDHKILALYKLLKYPFTEEAMKIFEKRSAPKMKIRNGYLYDYCMTGTLDAGRKREKSAESIVEEPIDQSPAASAAQQQIEQVLQQVIGITPAKQPENVPKPVRSFEVTPERKEKMWEYVEKDLGNVRNTEFVLTSFWINFAKTQKIPLKDCIYAGHNFAKYFTEDILPGVWEKSIDLKLKMYLLSDLKVKITEIVKVKLLTVFNVHVELDERRCIESWGYGQMEEEDEEEEEEEEEEIDNLQIRKTDNEEVENLENNELNGRNAFSPIDHLEMANFLYNEIFNNELQEPRAIQPKGNAIWKKFVELWNSQRSAVNLSSHYRRGFQSILYTVRMPHRKILELYKHLKIVVNRPVQEIMAKNFKAKIKFVDNRVVSWVFIVTSEEDGQSSRKRNRSPSSSHSSESDSLISRKTRKNLTKSAGYSTADRNPIRHDDRNHRQGEDAILEEDAEEVNAEERRWVRHQLFFNQAAPKVEEVDQENEEPQEPEEELIERPEYQELPEVYEPLPGLASEQLFETTRQILEEGLTVPPMFRNQFLRDVRNQYQKHLRTARSEQHYLQSIQLLKRTFQRQIRFLMR